jgi:hypothetical protein
MKRTFKFLLIAPKRTLNKKTLGGDGKMKKILSALMIALLMFTWVNTVEAKSNGEKIKTVRVEVYSVEKKYVFAYDEGDNQYALANYGYKKGDVVLIKLNKYGEILSQQKRNIERLLIVEKDGAWATGYNDLGEPYVVEANRVKVGDVVDVKVNVFGEILSMKQVKGYEKQVSAKKLKKVKRLY